MMLADINDEERYKEYIPQYGYPTVEKLINVNDNRTFTKLEIMIFIESQIELKKHINDNKIKISTLSHILVPILNADSYSNDQIIEFIKIAPHCLINYGFIAKLTPEYLKQVLNYSLNHIKHKYFLKSGLCNINIDKLKAIKLSYLNGYRMYKLIIGDIPIMKNAYYKPDNYTSYYIKYNFIIQFLSTYKKMHENNNTIIARFYKSPIFDINLLRIIFKLVLG